MVVRLVSLPFPIQHICIAPVFPIAVAGIAHRANGQAIGAINSARIGAAFIGHVLATTVLALAPPWVLSLVLAALGPAAVPVALSRPPASPDASTRGDAGLGAKPARPLRPLAYRTAGRLPRRWIAPTAVRARTAARICRSNCFWVRMKIPIVMTES